ncbi:hypothetical protein M422DRAFT_777077 [Sphaerobolus stellatus SS14]|nr:hypothetical protein M422DRAFT_777077 [Sphaerobolus stellatus SS14]
MRGFIYDLLFYLSVVLRVTRAPLACICAVWIVITVASMSLNGVLRLFYPDVFVNQLTSPQPWVCELPVFKQFVSCPPKDFSSDSITILQTEVEKTRTEGYRAVYSIGQELRRSAMDIYRVADTDIPQLLEQFPKYQFTGKEEITVALYDLRNDAVAAKDQVQWLLEDIDETAATSIMTAKTIDRRLEQRRSLPTSTSLMEREIYLSLVEDLAHSFDRMGNDCDASTRSIDRVGISIRKLFRLVDTTLGLEWVERERLKDRLWTMFGGNRPRLMSLDRNINYLQDLLKFESPMRSNLSNMKFIFSQMEKRIMTVKRILSTGILEGDPAIQFGTVEMLIEQDKKP